MPKIKRKKWTEHPSIVFEGYTDKKPRLDVMYNFRVDTELPKFASLRDDSKSGNDQCKEKSSSVKFGHVPDKFHSGSWKEWAKQIWDDMPFNKKTPPTVDESVASLKQDIKPPIPVQDAEQLRQRILDFASITKKNGQLELAAHLASQAELMSREIMLAKFGFGSYLTEADMIELFKTADFGLRLDWLSSYMDFLPEDVVTKKKAADGLKVFDNWVVLHYDPQGHKLREIEIVEEEEERRHDPILFGVIKGSDRLYFVADWITPDDDITLNKVLKTLGRDKLAESVITDSTSKLMEVMEVNEWLSAPDLTKDDDKWEN